MGCSEYLIPAAAVAGETGWAFNAYSLSFECAVTHNVLRGDKDL